MNKIDVGARVCDSISGFDGIVTAHCEYIAGYSQSLVQPRCKPDGEPIDPQWFDDVRLSVFVNRGFTLPWMLSDSPDKGAPGK